MAAERLVVAKCLKLIRDRGGYAEKVHGDIFQPASIDIFACYRGVFIGIECKDLNERPTARQVYAMAQIINAGGRAFVARSPSDVERILDEIDEEIDG